MTNVLRSGDRLSELRSNNGRSLLVYQGDGNVVVYRDQQGLWSTGTQGTSVGQAVLQGDGNFVVYNAEGVAIFDTQTSGHPNAELVVQDDGNVVIYDGGIALWNTGTQEQESEHTAPIPTPDQPVPPQPLPPPLNATVRLIQVTRPSDGTFVNRMYSYWSSAYLQGSIAHVFAGHMDGHPRFFEVNLVNGEVTPRGSRLPYTGEAEGWYWDAEGWIYLTLGARLLRANPFSGEEHTVVDISVSHPGCRLWQAHSSNNGRTHSATIQRVVNDGAYPSVASAVWRDGALLRAEPPKLGTIDESAISGNGRYWLIKETEDDHNRILDLETGVEHVLLKNEGALGHSDMGPDWAIGDDRTVGGATWMNLANPNDRRVLARFPDWNMGHVSIKAGRCLLTHGDLLTLLDPWTGFVTVLGAHGMVGNDYNHQVMANLDPTGRVVCYISNNGTDRFDVFLLVI